MTTNSYGISIFDSPFYEIHILLSIALVVHMRRLSLLPCCSMLQCKKSLLYPFLQELIAMVYLLPY